MMIVSLTILNYHLGSHILQSPTESLPRRVLTSGVLDTPPEIADFSLLLACDQDIFRL